MTIDLLLVHVSVTEDLSKLQTLADTLPPDWPDRFETIIDNLRDELVKLADAQLLNKESK